MIFFVRCQQKGKCLIDEEEKRTERIELKGKKKLKRKQKQRYDAGIKQI